MKFYKLVEITEDEYVDRTRDLDYDMYVCSKHKADDKAIYIAMQDDETEIDIDLDDFEEDE